MVPKQAARKQEEVKTFPLSDTRCWGAFFGKEPCKDSIGKSDKQWGKKKCLNFLLGIHSNPKLLKAGASGLGVFSNFPSDWHCCFGFLGSFPALGARALIWILIACKGFCFVVTQFHTFVGTASPGPMHGAVAGPRQVVAFVCNRHIWKTCYSKAQQHTIKQLLLV